MAQYKPLTPGAGLVSLGVMAQQIGKVTHYYGKSHAAVIDLTAPLKAGETVTFDRGDKRFTQVAHSIQIDHKPVEQAEACTSVGLEVEQAIKPGAAVYRGEAP